MQSLKGFALIILSATAFGFMPIFTRYAYADGISTSTLLFLRFAIASLFMLLVLRAKRMTLPTGKNLLGFALMGAVGYTAQSFCFFSAVKYAPVAVVSLILYVYPALVTLLSALILKEKVTLRKLASLGLALMGTSLIIGLGKGGDGKGILLACCAALIYSAYILCGSRLVGKGMAFQSSTVIMLFAALAFGGITAASGFKAPASLSGWLAVIALAFISTVIALLSFFAGMERIGPTNASLVSTLEPVVTVIAGALLLGEPATLLNLVGGALILLSLVLLAAAPHQAKPQEE